jgi:hypothetical protein
MSAGFQNIKVPVSIDITIPGSDRVVYVTDEYIFDTGATDTSFPGFVDLNNFAHLNDSNFPIIPTAEGYIAGFGGNVPSIAFDIKMVIHVNGLSPVTLMKTIAEKCRCPSNRTRVLGLDVILKLSGFWGVESRNYSFLHIENSTTADRTFIQSISNSARRFS